jgi:hypothetical protein
VGEREQLSALAQLHALLEGHRIEYWLFGGWAVDFHAGAVTRDHADLDIAVWARDEERIASLLGSDGWNHVPDEDEDGYTVYELGAVRLEVAFLARDETGRIYTPLEEGQGDWPPGAFEDAEAELAGVRARVISLGALRTDKAEIREDPAVAAKDRADTATLDRLA